MLFFKNKNNLKIPNHLAIIMDGNARWAKNRAVTTRFGHKVGCNNIKTITKYCIEYKIKYLSLYAFSSENWFRPKDEVDYLLELLKEYLEFDYRDLEENGVKIIISGNLNKLPTELINKISLIQDKTKNNNNIVLNVAFSYGGREEITDSLKKIVKKIENKELFFEQINEEIIYQNFYHPELPYPDLLIRTAGDQRVSNFMLWQIAYSELYFTKVFWPEFSKKHLLKALAEYSKRERRYGKRDINTNI